MAMQTKSRPPKRRPVQHPKRWQEARRPGARWLAAAGIALAILGGVVYGLTRGDEPTAVSGGLPNTPDYHSLLVAANDPNALVLGTHDGLFSSPDGGRTWSPAALGGQDAMNLARADGKTVWAAGHEVLAKTDDGGANWIDVRPDGLPGLDVHGFAVDPTDPGRLYAAIAGQGLYRSEDGGASFALVSREVGPNVMALAVTPDGRILAGDMRRGLLESNDRGATWRVRLEAGLMGLAVDPGDPERVLATGPGILLSEDGGRTWEQVLPLEAGAGPVAWARAGGNLAYVVGFDRTLYRTADGGRTWQAVGS